LSRSLAPAAVAEKFIPACGRCAINTADLIRSRYPQYPAPRLRYSLDELLPQRGFNVAKSLVGAEGTCVITLAAKVRLVGLAQKAHDCCAWI